MSKRKTLLAAGFVRDLRFQNHFMHDAYLAHLRVAGIKHKVLDTYYPGDGSVIVRVLSSADNAPLIQLFDD